MIKRFKTANALMLSCIAIFTAFGITTQKITFGMGLGDVFAWMLLVIILIALSVTSYVWRKEGRKLHFAMTLTSALVLLLAVLHATIWRDVLYAWNGNIFIR